MTLDLQANDIDERGAAYLGDTLGKNRVRRILFLSASLKSACLSLSLHLLQTLIVLDLRGNQIGDRGADHLVNSLQRNEVRSLEFAATPHSQTSPP